VAAATRLHPSPIRRAVVATGVLLLVLTISFEPSGGPAQAAEPPATGAGELAEGAGFDLDRVVEQVSQHRAQAQAGLPAIGPERPVSDPVGRPYEQTQPAVAFDGTNFLVVWSESGPLEDDSWMRIIGTRVSPEGEVLDPVGIRISDRAYIGTLDPAVVFDGDRFLVAWSINEIMLFGAFVGTDGVPQGPSWLITEQPTLYDPQIASNGSTFMLTWTVYYGGGPGEVAGILLDGDGQRLSLVDIAIGPADDFTPDVASDGDGYLVTWGHGTPSSPDAPSLLGARVDGTGAVLDPGGFPIATGAHPARPSVAYGGGQYLVTWQDDVGGSDILGARVSPAGAVLDSPPLLLSTTPGFFPSVAHDGQRFLAVWQTGYYDSADVFSTRIDQDGTVEEPRGLPVSTAPGGQSFPWVAAGPGASFVVWEDTSSPAGSFDVWGARLDASGSVLDPDGLLLTPGNSISSPAIAFNGTEHLVVWGDGRADRPTVIATRVRPDGTVVDPTGIVVSYSAADPTPVDLPPRVASDGTGFLVTFALADCTAKAVRIGADGAAVWPEIDLGPTGSCTSPGVAFNGTDYLVATAGPAGGVTATLVSPDGTVVSTSRLADSPPGVHPVAASVRGTVLVAWEGGAVVVNGAVTPVALPPAVSNGGEVAVGASDTSYLLARDTATGLVAVRIDVAGNVLDPTGIALPGDGGTPAIGFYGSWLVVWNDRRTTGAGPGLYGARIQRNGSLVASEFLIAPGVDADAALGTGARGDGWTLAYPRYDAGTLSTRTYLRTISPK